MPSLVVTEREVVVIDVTTPVTPTRWTQMCLAQNLPRSRRRHDNAQAFQFAHDPLIAPARVFAGDPQNQLACLGTAAGSATIRPTPGDQPTMPAEQCGRLDDE
jgi:hypothetical protein